jgi:hypothetical protein
MLMMAIVAGASISGTCNAMAQQQPCARGNFYWLAAAEALSIPDR